MGRETKINIAASLRAKLIAILSIGVLGFAMPAAASYLPFNTSVNMNVGIGSASPGASLDVNGTVRAIGFIAGAGGITLGGVNNTSWPAGGANYWNYSGVGNIGVSTTAAVGIGTTFIGGTGEAAFAVMNGNVGIGTWLPAAALDLHNSTGNWAQFGDSKTNKEGVAFGSIDASNGAQIDLQRQDGTTTMTISNANGSVGYAIIDSSNGPLDLNGNNAQLVGIATSSPGSQLSVLGGVSLGSYAIKTAPTGGLIVSGNVGIGSATPGQMLDVQGTVRMTGITLTGNGAASGNVLVGNSVGVGTWMPSSTLGITGGSGTNYWLLNGGSNVGINTTQAVGIGTSFVGGTGEAALSIMNGNVGIGTWLPAYPFQISGAYGEMSLLGVSTNSDVIHFGYPASQDRGRVGYSPSNDVLYLSTQSTIDFEKNLASLMFLDTNGNLGIGSSAPGQMLDVQGTARIKGLTLTGNGAGNGNVLVGNSVGVGTWMPVSTLGAASGTNYWLLNGGSNVGINTTQSVGIGTSFVGGTGEAALSVMNGNVGIGTWVPSGALNVMNGNVGIGTLVSNQKLAVVGGAILENQIGSTVDTVLIGDPPIGGFPGIWLGANASAPTYSNYSFLSDGTGGNLFNAASGQLTRFRINNAATLTAGGSGIRIFGADTGAPADAPIYPFQVLTANSNFIINSSGNVGINTVSPVSKLNVNGGVGIGTALTNGAYLNFNAAPSGGLIVQGNVGIGTFNPFGGGLIVLPANTGNVGIGSLTPGQALDVTGTVRMTGLTLTGNGAANGNVLVGNSIGVGTWMPASTLGAASGTNYWLLNGGSNVGINTTQAVGIGTSFVGGTGEAALSVMNGNVGIGTWVPKAQLDVEGTLSAVIFGGNVGIGTGAPNQALYVNGNMVINSAIYSANQLAYFSLQSNNELLDAPNIYLTGPSNADASINLVGSVAIGTTTYQNILPDGALIIEPTAGNVGIGTWTADGGNLIVNGGGNVGIATAWPGQALDVHGTARMTGLTLTGNGAANGNVLVGNGVGVGTWMPASTLGVSGSGGTDFWNYSAAGNIGVSTIQAVGIGTTFIGGTGEAALSVMKGNVGVGTWIAPALLTVNGSSTSNLTAEFSNGRYYFGDGQYTPNTSSTNVMDVFATDGSTDQILRWGPNYVDSSSIGGYLGYNGGGSTEISMYSNHADLYLGVEISSTNTPIIVIKNNSGKVGIGTTSPGSAFSVLGGVGIGSKSYAADYTQNNGLAVQGNVGIGTFNPFGGGLIVLPANTGNVGIGSITPGQALDVNGTVRMTGLALTGNGAANGNVLVGNSVGVGTWMPSSTLGITGGSGTNYWLLNGGSNVGINTTQAVGIGTSFVGGTGEAAFSVMNGNVGIGTWIPKGKLDVEGTLSTAYFASNVGIGTWIPDFNLDVYAKGQAFGIMEVGDQSGTYFQVSGALGMLGIRADSIGALNSLTTGIINGANSGSAGTEFFHESGTDAYTSGTGQLVQLWADPTDGQFNPSSGNGVYNMLEVDPNIDQTGTATGITRAIFINPNNPAAHDFRALEIAVGNVGIGTISGNLGIGSQWPGQRLDVNGTVRMTGFNIAAGAGAGKVLTSDANGNGTWGAAGAGTNYWLLNGGTNVGINTTQAVGIGTSFVGGTGEAKLSVMNGNVGIGTWVPGAALDFPYYPSGTGIHGGIGFGASNGAGNGFFLYQNSNNTMQFDVVAGIYIDNDFGYGMYLQPGHVDEITHYGDDSGTADTFFQFDTDNTITSLDIASGELIRTASVFHPTSGTYNYSGLMINDTINQTGTSAGITRGLFVNSVLTSTRDFRAIETSIGNVGIGTISGNLGIGSQWPGQRLDVQGTARMNGFTLSGNGAAAGNVLVGNSIGVGTWMPVSTLGAAGGSNYWLLNGGSNVGINTTQAVGIGTSFVGGPSEAALSVMNGNVGIGTWVPADTFQVGKYSANSSGFEIDSKGNVGIGTTITSFESLSIMNGNVGIGTFTTIVPFEVAINQAASTDMAVGNLTNDPNANAEIDAETNAGVLNVGIHSTSYAYDNGAAYLWNNANTDLYFGTNDLERVRITAAGNVGIGTTTPVGGLAVMNGNVGIGTWAPTVLTQINGAVTAYGQPLLEVTDSTAPGAYMMIGEGSSNLNTFEPLLRGVSANYGGTGLALQGQVPVANDVIGDPQEAAMLLDVERVGDTAIQSANLFSFASNDVSVMMINKNGNVGIGTISPFGGGLIVTNGNVGIGSLAPGQLLDVKGTVRMLGFNIANNAGAGKVLTSDASGNGTWGAAGAGSNYWLLNGGAGNVGINTSYAVGIGTSFVGGTGEAALSVMNGNVGIGTWVPNSGLQLNTSFAVYRSSTAASVQSAGQVIIGVTDTTAARTITLATADIAPGRVIIIKDESGGAATHNITVTTQGGQTIDSAASVTISANYGVIRVYSDGTKWFTF